MINKKMEIDVGELASASAYDIAKRVREGDLHLDKPAEAAIERGRRVNPKLNAVIHWCDDFSAHSIREPRGQLAGVPVLAKDLFIDVAGAPTRNGSKSSNLAPVAVDSEIVARYRQAGARLIGKTATPEFGIGPSTESAAFGVTSNPWGDIRSAAGSSGGSAAAVAAGIAPIAIGSDGGGSIRLPAAMCGLVGLKPTRGRTPIGPGQGDGFAGLASVGSLTRSVRDAQLALCVTEGCHPGDMHWAPIGAASLRRQAKLRVGVLDAGWWPTAMDSHCREGLERTATLMKTLGHEVKPISLGLGPEKMLAATAPVFSASIAALVEKCDHRNLEPATVAIAETGQSVSGSQYVAACVAMSEIGAQIGKLFDEVDLLLSPTAPIEHYPHGHINLSKATLAEITVRMNEVITFTSPFNASGNPAVSLPLHWTDKGLPIGMQLVAPVGEDHLLLEVASMLEAARPWEKRQAALITKMMATEDGARENRMEE
ncbi:amidase [uncultured Erythrobacter sp.]|uniref:amidase n=1 Tax=uncultured Erythrobacter sp. TaxID=263913 RepID=UPI00260BA742|nr:amidase [uncultured Erythrobacter sp.]